MSMLFFSLGHSHAALPLFRAKASGFRLRYYNDRGSPLRHSLKRSKPMTFGKPEAFRTEGGKAREEPHATALRY